jgi:xylan 1,4-beta-xylosidase
MLGMMQGKRLAVTSTLAYDFRSICDSSVRGNKTDINALASKTTNSITILLWNYHDKDIQDDGSLVSVTVKNISTKSATLYHYRIDNNHSNSYEEWKKMGSPKIPTSEQIHKLEISGQLEMLHKPTSIKIENTQFRIEMQLPRQAVSLLKLVLE